MLYIFSVQVLRDFYYNIFFCLFPKVLQVFTQNWFCFDTLNFLFIQIPAENVVQKGKSLTSVHQTQGNKNNSNYLFQHIGNIYKIYYIFRFANNLLNFWFDPFGRR